MSWTFSELRFRFNMFITAAKVEHFSHLPKVIGINENDFFRVHFDNFNNQYLPRLRPKTFMRSVT